VGRGSEGGFGEGGWEDGGGGGDGEDGIKRGYIP
jgi:hypothetical protein